MRRARDRALVAIVAVLAGGGWVCDSSVDNRCPGAVTCDIEIANVCCPLGSLTWCDGTCGTDGCGGARTPSYCDDQARILDCSFNATIDSATCDSPASTPHGVQYTVTLKGTLSGCGQEGVLFVSAPKSEPEGEASCGSWDDGVFGGCVSPAPQTTQTHYSFTEKQPAGTATIEIQRMHGDAPPLVMTTVTCGGG